MPAWLAIAIPSLIAVAACVMWAVDYVKKAHEIEKLRLELERLRLDGIAAERTEDLRASGLYTPTPEEIDRVVRERRDRDAYMRGFDDGRKEGWLYKTAPRELRDLHFNLSTLLPRIILIYLIVRLLTDMVVFVKWLF